MTATVKEILELVRENDIKFIRLTFSDLLGSQKSISIMTEELERAVDSGISFDASAVKGFLTVDQSDLLLFPDLSTMRILPWRPQQGQVARFFCGVRYPDGSPFQGDSRRILQQAAIRAEGMGFTCKIGPECEFYLFETDEWGRPTDRPYDQAGYLDTAPLDRGENVRREICLCLEQMGIQPVSSHHEQGPGQNEVDFRFNDIVTAADDLLTFQSVVKVIAAGNGLFASFLPKPLPGFSGSGLHVNISLEENGVNIFKNSAAEHSRTAESFIAGVMGRVSEITAILNPLGNSYARLGEMEAPKYVSWSHGNRSQLVRIPPATGEYARMELRSPDPGCNPYLAFALLLHAGLDGIEAGTPLPPPSDFDMYRARPGQVEGLKQLPRTLSAALGELEYSAFAKGVLGEGVLRRYLQIKGEEWARYAGYDTPQKADGEMYFPVI